MKLSSAIKYILFFFLLAGMSCEENAIVENTFKIGTPTAFRINQLYYSSNEQYTLQINEIGDSRCPEGVVCIWEGEVTLKGQWTVNKNKTPIELHSVVSSLQKEPDGFTFQIIDAKPYPKYGIESKPEDLVVTLLIKTK